MAIPTFRTDREKPSRTMHSPAEAVLPGQFERPSPSSAGRYTSRSILGLRARRKKKTKIRRALKQKMLCRNLQRPTRAGFQQSTRITQRGKPETDLILSDT